MKSHIKRIQEMTCITMMCVISVLIHAQSFVDSIKVSNDSILVDSLNTLSRNHFSSDLDKARQYAEAAMQKAQSISYANGAAVAYKNIGITYYYKANSIEALSNYQKALDAYRSTNNLSGLANIYSNMGVVFIERGDIEKAIENYVQSLKYSEQAGDKYRTLVALNNIGGAYDTDEKDVANMDKALENYTKAIAIALSLNKTEEAGDICINIGNIYSKKQKLVLSRKKEYNDSAKVYYEKSLSYYQGSDHSGYAYDGLGKYYREEKQLDLALLNHQKALAEAKKSNIKLREIQALTSLGIDYKEKNEYDKAIDYFTRSEKLATEIDNKLELKDMYEEIAKTYELKKDYQNAYKYQRLFTNMKDSLTGDELKKRLGSLQFEIDIQRKESEINLLTKNQELSEQKLERQRLAKYASLSGLGLVLLIAGILFRNNQQKRKTNIILDKQKAEIESLLFNILPEEVAHELRQTGAATPRYYENVSVMFTDFKGFTALADQLSPQEVIAELDENFIAFDNIVDKYKLEKIKTIGDAYMCAAGIPTPQSDHYYQIMRAAIEIRDYVNKNNEKRRLLGKQLWEIRIGIHIGPLVAGVVGKRKYAYDIWGNTVNIASRMETNVEPGNIAISSRAYEMVKDKFNCTYHGKINAKNVGDIDMYVLESEKTFSKLEFAN